MAKQATIWSSFKTFFLHQIAKHNFSPIVHEKRPGGKRKRETLPLQTVCTEQKILNKVFKMLKRDKHWSIGSWHGN